VDKSNPIVTFLEGSWHCETVRVHDGEVFKTAYDETMRKIDGHTLEITAYGMNNGKDLTKPMKIVLEGCNVTLAQDSFMARGSFKGNVVKVSGNTEDGNHHRLKIVLMDNVFIYQSDVWRNDTIVDTQWSHLRRLEE